MRISIAESSRVMRDEPSHRVIARSFVIWAMIGDLEVVLHILTVEDIEPVVV